ncbi:B12-binding domain-containing protein [Bacillus sp. FJAT-26390]|uniref:MerR family transcriptional regulator n=1 Tax=Bacillus sp. FJAT-26390 TaxID=1743142 RepID=UPI0008081500|nr:B12-binding domain-containing protein [Bacillus sp. FJAT-26390]OBZ16782.1 MerR family transcriptional regulator [Bacillus sp. FJAT-26390]
MNHRLFTIKEASMRTSLSTQLIRKWEERYEAVIPQRMANGYRGYTNHDIETLLWFKKQVDEGVPIGMAVQEWKNADHAAMDWTNPIEQLLQSFIELDLTNAERIYEQLLAVLQLENLMLQILEPTLVELGERWERGEISEYQEHFGSLFIRDKMLAIRGMIRTVDDSPLMVTACGPGERHELGILFFGYFAQMEGFRVVYLGSSPSEKGIFDCLVEVRPAAFTFSFSVTQALEEAVPFLQELDQRITGGQLSTKVFIGGKAIYEDGLLAGTKHVHMLVGDGKRCVEKIKTRFLIPNE